MASERDPEGNELAHLVNAQTITDKQILEIGCGDGKFTNQYSHFASRVIGIDPDWNDLHCIKNMGLPGNVHFIQAKGEALPFRTGIYDLVIYTSSL